jgi:hypothetical protein
VVVPVDVETFPNSEQTVISSSGSRNSRLLFEINELKHVPLSDIDQLHVSVVRTSDFPRRLRDIEYRNFLSIVSPAESGGVAKLYEPVRNGYELGSPLDTESVLALGRFLLSRGKLFEAQDRPIFYSTLASVRQDRPFLAMMSAQMGLVRSNGREGGAPVFSASGVDRVPRIAWAKPYAPERIIRTDSQEFDSALYVAIPGKEIHQDEIVMLYVQIVMIDRTTRNYYLYSLPQ